MNNEPGSSRTAPQKYHIANEKTGKRSRPLTLRELSNTHLTTDMLAWTEGMAAWVPVSQIPELQPYVLPASTDVAEIMEPPRPQYAQFEGEREPPPPPPPPPPPGRIASVTTLGIVNIVLASLSLVTLPLSLLFSLGQPEGFVDVVNVSRFRFGLLVCFALNVVIAIVQAAGGIGLLRQRLWGRSLSLVYACLALVSLIAGAAFTVIVLVMPIMAAMDRAGGDANDRAWGYVGGLWGGLAGGICGGVIYPIIILVFMNFAAVRRNLR
jgi:hypothetical protein